MLLRHGIVETGQGHIGYGDLRTGEVEYDLLGSQFNQRGVSFSPDGQRIAYVSDAGGSAQVYVASFPIDIDSPPVQVSVAGGTESPTWAHNGHELFYIPEGWLTVATFDIDPVFSVTDRQRLFDARLYWDGEGNGWRQFDVSLDDQRFLMLRGGRRMPEHTERLVRRTNFFEELKRLVPNN